VTAYHPCMGIVVRAGAAVAAVLALGACGSTSSTVAADPGTAPPTSTSPSPTGSPTPDSPRCAGVWNDGRTLPASYRGCAASQGWVKAQVYQCSDGHRIVTYAHAFYAAPGHTITRSASTLAKDTDFRHLMATCGA
jgi:hypothetical protein